MAILSLKMAIFSPKLAKNWPCDKILRFGPFLADFTCIWLQEPWSVVIAIDNDHCQHQNAHFQSQNAHFLAKNGKKLAVWKILRFGPFLEDFAYKCLLDHTSFVFVIDCGHFQPQNGHFSLKWPKIGYMTKSLIWAIFGRFQLQILTAALVSWLCQWLWPLQASKWSF